ncbi:MAG TPA: hypothetical protein PKI49_03075 [Pseudomonadota bacterium]|nr:hypothetical protein [Pseudomonadota bacterium]HNO67465.1 hypothetical protein [Pseudomonadota bacterium]
MLRRGFRNSFPPRASGGPPTRISVTDLPSFLDDRQQSDVCIGVPSNQGSLSRVLLRQRLTMLAAIDHAGQLAERLAEEHDETVLSPSLQPSSVHVVPHPDGCQVWLDYDLSARTRNRTQAMVMRRLTLLVWVRQDSASMSSPNPLLTRDAAPDHAPIDSSSAGHGHDD